jgi:hypothetical protein
MVHFFRVKYNLKIVTYFSNILILSLADQIIEGIHDVIPDDVENLIPEQVMDAVENKVEDLAGKLPDNVEAVAEKVVDALNN